VDIYLKKIIATNSRINSISALVANPTKPQIIISALAAKNHGRQFTNK